MVLLAGLVATLSSGCTEDYPPSPLATPSHSALSTGEHVFVVHPGHGDLLALSNPSQGEVDTKSIPVCDSPSPPVTSPAGMVIVHCVKAGRLVAIDPGDLQHVTVDLGATFDRLAFSEDGAAAVAYYSPTGQDSSRAEGGDGLSNPHQLALIRLDRLTEDASASGTADDPVEAHRLLIPSHGAVPSSVTLGPISDGRRIGLVHSSSYVLLFDFERPQEPVVTAFLSVEAGRNMEVRKILFSDDGQSVVVVARGSDDIFVLHLPPPGHGIRPSINQFAAGRNPTDVVEFTGQDGNQRLLSANPGNRSISIIDPTSSRQTELRLDRAVNRILLYTPEEDGAGTVALMYNTDDTTLLLVDLPAVESAHTRAIEVLTLAAAPEHIELMPGDGLAGIVHRTQVPLSLLDLNARTLSPFSGSALPSSTLFAPEESRIYLMLDTTPPTLTWVDTATRLPYNTQLESSGQLLMLPHSKQIAIYGESRFGAISFYGMATPSRAEATYAYGFFLTGELNR